MTAPSVLVAEDSLVIRAVLVEQLRSRGYRVLEAGDGEQALAACQRERPDVVLLDVEMPQLDGQAVLAGIKADPRLADIPVVFVTARVTTEDVVEGLRLGAHDYLRKPFEPSELLARVSAAARIKALQDELRLRNAELELASRTDALTGLPTAATSRSSCSDWPPRVPGRAARDQRRRGGRAGRAGAAGDRGRAGVAGGRAASRHGQHRGRLRDRGRPGGPGPAGRHRPLRGQGGRPRPGRGRPSGGGGGAAHRGGRMRQDRGDGKRPEHDTGKRGSGWPTSG